MSERFQLAVSVLCLVVGISVRSATAQTDSIPRQQQVSHISRLPEYQFGFGAGNAGFHIHYSTNSTVHIGVNLLLDVNSYDSASTSVTSTYYEIGPYLKYLLVHGRIITPYVQTSLVLIRPGHDDASLIRGSGRKKASGEHPATETRLTIAFGGEYFFNRHIGIYAHAILARAFLGDPTSFNVGVVGGVAGAEFFF